MIYYIYVFILENAIESATCNITAMILQVADSRAFFRIKNIWQKIDTEYVSEKRH